MGDHHPVEASLPEDLEVVAERVYEPETLLSARTIKKGDINVAQVLIQGVGFHWVKLLGWITTGLYNNFLPSALGTRQIFLGRALIHINQIWKLMPASVMCVCQE